MKHIVHFHIFNCRNTVLLLCCFLDGVLSYCQWNTTLPADIKSTRTWMDSALVLLVWSSRGGCRQRVFLDELFRLFTAVWFEWRFLVILRFVLLLQTPFLGSKPPAYSSMLFSNNLGPTGHAYNYAPNVYHFSLVLISTKQNYSWGWWESH